MWILPLCRNRRSPLPLGFTSNREQHHFLYRGVNHEKNNSDKTNETLAEAGQAGSTCAAGPVSFSIHWKRRTAALGNRSEGAEFCGNDCGRCFSWLWPLILASLPIVLIWRAVSHTMKKAAIQNATFQADEDFDYYREKLTGSSARNYQPLDGFAD